jgi:hypothetical protein
VAATARSGVRCAFSQFFKWGIFLIKFPHVFFYLTFDDDAFFDAAWREIRLTTMVMPRSRGRYSKNRLQKAAKGNARAWVRSVMEQLWAASNACSSDVRANESAAAQVLKSRHDARQVGDLVWPMQQVKVEMVCPKARDSPRKPFQFRPLPHETATLWKPGIPVHADPQ